jgi:hypothetical protein
MTGTLPPLKADTEQPPGKTEERISRIPKEMKLGNGA